MKVLIVDDFDKKIALLRQLLAESNVGDDDIDIVQCSADARRTLSEQKYDLLVLDLSLPLRPGDRLKENEGVRLLEEISSRDEFWLPDHVVGITGFEKLFHKHSGDFQKHGWLLDLFDENDVGWQQRFKAKVNWIDAASHSAENIDYGTDVAIITALDSPELAAFRRLPWDWRVAEMLDGMAYCYAGSLEDGNRTYSIIATSAPKMGMLSTGVHAQKVIQKYRPRIIVMGGICAGVEGEVNLGDILFASVSWDFLKGKKVSQRFEAEADHISADQGLVSRFMRLAEDRRHWLELWDNYPSANRTEKPPTLVNGPIACSSFVVADKKAVKSMKVQNRKLIGVEMEIFGLYYAARLAAHPKPQYFAIKSVCDFANEDKSDDYQEFCSFMSAKCIEKYLQDNLHELVV